MNRGAFVPFTLEVMKDKDKDKMPLFRGWDKPP
jgi:hypothetical protein